MKYVKHLKRFFRNESGATAIEYALIAAMISLSVIAGASLIGNGISNTLDKPTNAIQTVADKSFD
ncbi:Flp family type IVb pilin [Robiginitomaculum antarcticum]|uniref:Flp family type IVb pilin n=1 Tax=Robiginitomaculum antarcticum TaxID=437507 RepID=UPI00036A73F6|nr:Flp family type IVb pilin [Robiginitomaculum antarcticum]